MRSLLFLLFSQLSLSIFAQFPLVKLEFHGNLDVWRPYTETTQLYIADGGVIHSNHWALAAKCLVFSKNNFFFYTGINYQRINHAIIDYVTSTTYFNHHNGTTETHHFTDPLDLLSHSDRLGISLSSGRTLHSNDHLIGQFFLSSEFYILEYYKFHYRTTSYLYSEFFEYYREYHRSKYLFPELNVSLDYSIMLLLKKGFSLGATVQIGTNLYSDWDQFKKYAWLGVGLELGIGRSKKERE